ncbi:MAG: IS630 family transposase [Deltaproteobacteria bacterium]|nr:IS630 family transposase [Deltaproteobacteria bacterium]
MGPRETVVFQDETGFTLHSRLGRGWAKKGVRLRIPTTSQHAKRLNVSGWVAPLLGRYGFIRTAEGNREGFLEVLKSLYKKLRGYRIFLYVDRARWHRGEPVLQFLKTHRRLYLNYLPPYQPGLNCQERIWRRVRYEATTNRWFESLDIIWTTVRTTTHSWSPQKIRRLCHIT